MTQTEPESPDTTGVAGTTVRGLDAGVHALRARGRVHVRGVAGQDTRPTR